MDDVPLAVDVIPLIETGIQRVLEPAVLHNEGEQWVIRRSENETSARPSRPGA